MVLRAFVVLHMIACYAPYTGISWFSILYYGKHIYLSKSLCRKIRGEIAQSAAYIPDFPKRRTRFFFLGDLATFLYTLA